MFFTNWNSVSKSKPIDGCKYRAKNNTRVWLQQWKNNYANYQE